MVHGGAGEYYAPNECVGVTVIPIVVQLGTLQWFAKCRAEYGCRTMLLPMRTNRSLNSFLRAGPAWLGLIVLGKEDRQQVAQRAIVRMVDFFAASYAAWREEAMPLLSACHCTCHVIPTNLQEESSRN